MDKILFKIKVMRIYSNALYIQRIYALLIAFITLKYFLDGIVTTTITRALECIMLGAMVYYYIKCMPSVRHAGKYISVLLILLIVWSSVIVWRGNWNVGMKQMVFNVIDPRGVSLYLLPLLFFLPYNVISIKKILNVFFIGAILSFPLWLLNANHLIQAGQERSYMAEGIGASLPFIAAFLMMFTPCFSKRKNLIIIVVYAIYFLLMLLNARRNVCFSLLCYGLIDYYLYLHFINRKRLFFNLIVMLFSLLSVIIVLNNMDSLSNGTFRYMNERVKEDSRSGVEELFLADFSQAPFSDWICGRGINGTYYQERRNAITGLLETDRPGIETGYLDMILKGGIIYVLLILMILLPAIYKGLKSGKMFGVTCGLFLSTYLIDMYTTSPISNFSVRAILFWFCISICYSEVRYIDVGGLRRLKKHPSKIKIV